MQCINGEKIDVHFLLGKQEHCSRMKKIGVLFIQKDGMLSFVENVFCDLSAKFIVLGVNPQPWG